MRAGSELRVRFVFGMLGFVPVFLAGWLAWLQVAGQGELRWPARPPQRLVAATADAQSARREVVPAPRGTIVDRAGTLLAVDRDAYDVRARLAVPLEFQRDVHGYLDYLATVAGELASALASDPDLADRKAARQAHLDAILQRFADAFGTRQLAGAGGLRGKPLPKSQPRIAELRIAGGIDVLAVVEALRAVDAARPSVTLHFLPTHERSYTDADVTAGYVGHVDSAFGDDGRGGRVLTTFGVCGLEALAAVAPGDAAERAFRQDGKGRPYFLTPLVGESAPNVVHGCLDLELQREAGRLLREQAEAGSRESRARPKWGALVLVEIATGDVLAAASWHRDQQDPRNSSFAPYQNLCEPGSIVKPLVLAHALELGVLDWNRTFDCAPGSEEYRERVGSRGRARPVRDDHACGVLTPHGIVVNSSNIGAAYVGLLLSREQWRDYMVRYGFGAPLGLPLPNGRVGGTPRQSFDPRTPLRSFQANSAISFSFGYELQVTALHVARAYLRLFRGASSELRVCRGVEAGGAFHAAPVSPAGEQFSPTTVEAVRAAMVDVVSGDPHATGATLHARFLADEGIDLHGIVGGKTGTAASRVGPVEMRNASFVGLLPAQDPRWLAVCVLQKDDSAKFYGSSYAAPPAVRLLLRARQLAEQRLARQEPRAPDGQVRLIHASPGGSGWGRGAPETTLAGR